MSPQTDNNDNDDNNDHVRVPMMMTIDNYNKININFFKQLSTSQWSADRAFLTFVLRQKFAELGRDKAGTWTRSCICREVGTVGSPPSVTRPLTSRSE